MKTKPLPLLLLVLAGSTVYTQAVGAPANNKEPAKTSNAAPSGTSDLLKKLRMKVEQFTPQKKLSATTAVGGVRGSSVGAADVYWKGEAEPMVIDEDELMAFQKGMDLVDEDQIEQAHAAFADFLKAYPYSLLKEDASSVLSQLATAK